MCALDCHLVRTRCMSGSPTVRVWPTHGAHLARPWCARSVCLARLWCASDPLAVCILLASGARPARPRPPHMAPGVWTTKPPGFSCFHPRLSWVQSLPMRPIPPWLSQGSKGLTVVINHLIYSSPSWMATTLKEHISLQYYYSKNLMEKT